MAHLVDREHINLQSAKIREVAEALINAGHHCLDDQANALGLPRSTTWTILHTQHKNRGLSASVIKRMLAQTQLPGLVRRKIVEYIEQKSCGAYGHSPRQVRHFASGLAAIDRDGANSPCRARRDDRSENGRRTNDGYI
jgi:hypothetical protein